ncbi:MAG: hypothetical protein QE262_01655 [Candidatus Methylopumilus sp.]|jgi:hypothetical protein|nr:hypothetical protein [Candidatus Methylopumilus sp.]
MRSTKASSAVERLNKRGEQAYSMGTNGKGLFWLSQPGDDGISTKLCEPMTMDDFVAFVNGYGPQIVKRISKLDVEFSKQLMKK